MSTIYHSTDDKDFYIIAESPKDLITKTLNNILAPLNTPNQSYKKKFSFSHNQGLFEYINKSILQQSSSNTNEHFLIETSKIFNLFKDDKSFQSTNADKFNTNTMSKIVETDNNFALTANNYGILSQSQILFDLNQKNNLDKSRVNCNFSNIHSFNLLDQNLFKQQNNKNDLYDSSINTNTTDFNFESQNKCNFLENNLNHFNASTLFSSPIISKNQFDEIKIDDMFLNPVDEYLKENLNKSNFNFGCNFKNIQKDEINFQETFVDYDLYKDKSKNVFNKKKEISSKINTCNYDGQLSMDSKIFWNNELVGSDSFINRYGSSCDVSELIHDSYDDVFTLMNEENKNVTDKNSVFKTKKKINEKLKKKKKKDHINKKPLNHLDDGEKNDLIFLFDLKKKEKKTVISNNIEKKKTDLLGKNFNKKIPKNKTLIANVPLVNKSNEDENSSNIIFNHQVGKNNNLSLLMTSSTSSLKLNSKIVNDFDFSLKNETRQTRSRRGTVDIKKQLYEPEKKRRLGPRSKNGCWTCRVRHKACPENKPTCNQCERLHLFCDYSEERPAYMIDPLLQATKLKEIRAITSQQKRINFARKKANLHM